MRRPMLSILLVFAVLSALAAGGAARAADEKKKGGGETYLQFPTLTASMIRLNGGRGVLTVETGLDVPDAGLRMRAEESEPRLRDAYVSYLLTYAASIQPGAPPDPDAISVSLQRATDQVLGRPGAKLLLGTVLVT